MEINIRKQIAYVLSHVSHFRTIDNLMMLRYNKLSIKVVKQLLGITNPDRKYD